LLITHQKTLCKKKQEVVCRQDPQLSADPEPEFDYHTPTNIYIPAKPDYTSRSLPPTPLPLPSTPKKPMTTLNKAAIRAIVTPAVQTVQNREEKAFKTPNQKEFSG